MVELPRYVKSQCKANGRVFYYYERYRNTPRAWPRLALPLSPQSPEFWQRAQQYECLEAERGGETWAWHYRVASGRAYDLPNPKEGIEAFWKALDAAEKAERDLLAGEGKTFRALIAAYKDSPAYEKLSASSKSDYDRYLDVILVAWADDAVRTLRPEDAQEAIDAYKDTPASGRYFRSVLSKLVAYGVPRGYAPMNVVESTEKPEHESQPYPPWPDWAFELFFEHARIGLHLPVYSALYTGQRSVDVVPMLRPTSDAEAIQLVARKTGANVWVPIHSEYREVIAATRMEHVRLHLREDGEAWTLAGFRTAWQRELTFTANDDAPPDLRAKVAAMKRLRDAGIVFHGLRKNAVNMLLEVGCTEAEVSAIVEMSEAMVRHYARDVNKRRLAVNAMKKLEAAWTDMRPILFGRGAANR